MTAAANNGAAPTLADLRTALLSRFGKMYPDVIRPPLPDGVEGDIPQWPQGEAYRMIQAGDGELIFATEGLSDPFPDGRPGLNYEFLIKRPVPQDGFRGPDDLDSIFEFHYLREVALNALLWPDLGPQIDKFGTISIQLPTDAQRVPYLSHGPKGPRIVALLGARKWPEIAPGKRLVSVTIILPQEASDLDGLDASGRTMLAKRLEEAGHGWSSRALRDPIHLNG